MPRLYCAISDHGFGHLTQTAPLLNALYARCPGLEVVIHSALEEAQLRRMIHVPFMHWSEQVDVGMVMKGALRVDLEQTLEAYRRFHQGWVLKVKVLEQALQAWGAELVLSNVAYLPLLAAQLVDLDFAVDGHDVVEAKLVDQATYAGFVFGLRPGPD